MPLATVVKTWHQDTRVCLAVRVAEPSGESVEYVGCVEVTSAWRSMSDTERRQVLTQAVREARDRAQPPPPPPVPSMTGTVSL